MRPTPKPQAPAAWKTLMQHCVRIAMFVSAFAVLGTSWAASVYVKALEYDRADVIINGSETRPMWVGDTLPEGVALRGISGDSASFEIQGKLWSLKAGQGTYSQVTLRADPHGQFFVTAEVNGSSLRAIIDTGATAVSMNSEDA